MNREEIHEQILQHLIDLKVIFSPRKRNTRQKLERKLWFLCGPNYTSISFWNGYDNRRKIPNIAIVISNSFPNHVRLVLSSITHSVHFEILNEIAMELNATYHDQLLWTKTYEQECADITVVKNVLTKFIDTEKQIIDAIIENREGGSIAHITNGEFLGYIKNLNEYRNQSDKLKFDSSEVIGERVVRRTTGKINLKTDDYVRTILASRLIIKREHSKYQQKLFESLADKYPQNHLIMEEDYIDLKMESEDEITLFEVKPYNSVFKCIREGLGQLLNYTYRLDQTNDKQIKLIIAGPKEPDKEEAKYIKFIAGIQNIPFEYLPI